MPTYRAPLRDVRFLLDEVLELDHSPDLPSDAVLDADARAMIFSEAARLSEEVLAPLNRIGDEQGCTLEEGVVSTPVGFRQAFKTIAAGGWLGMAADARDGGQGLSPILSAVVDEMFCAANFALSGYVSIGRAAANAIAEHGMAHQRKRYVPKLVTGEWLAAMGLTEPNAGSDLSLVSTRARPGEDGTYRITGSKSFTTGGGHDLTDNVVNLVLARLPDAPPGTRGLSLFIVPRRLVDADGEPGAPNGVSIGGIEHKMGAHGSPTCIVNYDDAVGELVGAAGRGLTQMFTMVNEVRLEVGIQGVAIAEVAHQNALAYAHERRQGRSPLVDEHEGAADPIVAHADVRRMLLTMRALAEGGRAVTLWTALALQRAKYASDPARADALRDRVSLLTPVIKAHLTDVGFEAANLGVQCLGGHGYIRDWGVEQFVRDVRVTQLYEGTNGIQALDLVGRKLPSGDGRHVETLLADFEALAVEPDGVPDVTQPLRAAVEQLRSATDFMRERWASDRPAAMAGATDYQRLLGLVLVGVAWARMAKVARDKLDAGADDPFYRAKLATARFYAERMLPEAETLRVRATSGLGALAEPEPFLL